MAGVKRRVVTGSDIRALHKELDEVSCPICMDYPHNAVLLLCSSHDKGCKSYICDTSHRHSNCLDRFKKLRASEDGTSGLHGASESHNLPEEENIEDSIQDTQEGVVEIRDSVSIQEGTEHEGLDMENASELKLNLKCPMCRGAILGWEVVEEARDYLNLKRRSCSRESCSFSGSYQELRRHARRVHPTTRPSDIDPSRERAWRRLENQREYGDIVSAVRSAMPGAIVVGDYVIENGDRFSAGRDGRSGGNGPLWSTFLLFQMISSSIDGLPESRPPRSRAWTRHRRSAATTSLPERRFLWGENLLGLHNDHDEEHDVHILSDIGEEESPVPRRRRRLTRARSDEDQP